MLSMASAVIIALAAMACGTKIALESRRERRHQSWSRTCGQLPQGSRLAGLEPDGWTIVEVGQFHKNKQGTRGQR